MEWGRVCHGPAKTFKQQGGWSVKGTVVGAPNPQPHPWERSEPHHLRISAETEL
jgi:hypothetical protein